MCLGLARTPRPQSNQRGIETCGAISNPCQGDVGPQSNQRGIETGVNGGFALASLFGPQSNQRGIETGLFPQSLARFRSGLNRTSVGLKRGRPMTDRNAFMSLNRTSVGLKRKLVRKDRCGDWKPQSNQRGIETGWARGLCEDCLQGLNRTSVGLKRRSSLWFW